ncbi:MAG TPA: serine hydrolase [Pyrinomonadaceae bacterium]|nr:serine hydrolase [Pyrinomonadaceae bacterium]
MLLPIAVKGETRLQMKLADRMQFYKTPGVSVAFINNGQVEWARAYGTREAGGREPVTTETIFQAGSISKAVTAIAVLRLVEAGKLKLDEDVNQKLVSWKVPENELTKEKKVTLRRLLSHSAGVNVPSFMPGYLKTGQIPTLVQLLNGTKPATNLPIRVEQAPGGGFSYSGGGYTIVQQLLIDVVGKPFPELMDDLVFRPLKMKNTTFEQQPSTKIDRPVAAGHDANGQPPPGKWRMFPEMSAAGIWSTASDLARLAIDIEKAQRGKSKFLSAATVNEMLVPQAGRWGLGFTVDGEGSSRRFGHGGDNGEFSANLVAYATSGQGVVIMTNGVRGGRLISEILRSIAHEYGWPDFRAKEKTIVKVDPKVYADYIGRYQFEFSSDYVLTIIAEGDKLVTELKQPTSTSRTEIYPESETTFFRRDVDVEVMFVRDETGRVKRLIFRQDGQDFRLTRIQ